MSSCTTQQQLLVVLVADDTEVKSAWTGLVCCVWMLAALSAFSVAFSLSLSLKVIHGGLLMAADVSVCAAFASVFCP